MKYKRIVIKISGEALSDNGFGVSAASVRTLALQLRDVVSRGVQLGVVVGGGNYWRGRAIDNMDRSIADNVGMLATVMNGLTLGEELRSLGVDAKVVSSIGIDKVVEQYDFAKVNGYLNDGKLVVFAGGTGLPYFSTDTALALRACEMHADAVFFLKNIDGVYDCDPKLNPKAKKYDCISYDKVIADNLKVMDMTAIAMCREFGMTAVVVGMNEKDAILRAVDGDKTVGTVVKND